MTRGEALIDLISLLCASAPPEALKAKILTVERLSDLDENDHMKVQDFIAERLVLQWSTGIGTIEGIDHMVDEAVNNSQRAFDQAEPFLLGAGLELFFLNKAMEILKGTAKELKGLGNTVLSEAFKAVAFNLKELLKQQAETKKATRNRAQGRKKATL